MTVILLTFPSTGHSEGHCLLDGCSALHTLLHDGRTASTGHQVQAWLEQHPSILLRTHQTLLDLGQGGREGGRVGWREGGREERTVREYHAYQALHCLEFPSSAGERTDVKTQLLQVQIPFRTKFFSVFCLIISFSQVQRSVSCKQLPHTTHCAKVHPSHTHLVPSCHSLLAQRAPLHPPPTLLTGCHVSTRQQNLLPLGTATHQTLHHSRAIGGLEGGREEGREGGKEGEREGGIEKKRGVRGVRCPCSP